MTPLRAIVIMDVWFERQFQSETGRGVIRLARDGKGFEGARRACAITSRGKISPSSTASSSMSAWMCSCVRRGAVRRRRRVALHTATQAGGPLPYDSLSSETVWIRPGVVVRERREGATSRRATALADSEPTPFTPQPSPTCSLRLLSLAPLSLHTALWIRRPSPAAPVCPARRTPRVPRRFPTRPRPPSATATSHAARPSSHSQESAGSGHSGLSAQGLRRRRGASHGGTSCRPTTAACCAPALRAER